MGGRRSRWLRSLLRLAALWVIVSGVSLGRPGLCSTSPHRLGTGVGWLTVLPEVLGPPLILRP